MKLALFSLLSVAAILVGDNIVQAEVEKTPYKHAGYQLYPDYDLVVPIAEWIDDARARSRTDHYQGLQQHFEFDYPSHNHSQYLIFYQVNQDHAQPPTKVCLRTVKKYKKLSDKMRRKSFRRRSQTSPPPPLSFGLRTRTAPCPELVERVPEVNKNPLVLSPNSSCLLIVSSSARHVWLNLSTTTGGTYPDGTELTLLWWKDTGVPYDQFAYSTFGPMMSPDDDDGDDELTEAFTLPGECDQNATGLVTTHQHGATPLMDSFFSNEDDDEAVFPYRMGGLLPELADLAPTRYASTFDHTQYNLSAIPETWDWRQQGVVSPVKNQAKCSSCWAFSAVAALEAAYARKYGERMLLSEQQLIDCARNATHLRSGSMGCLGGMPHLAFEYLMDRGLTPGLASDEDYGHYQMVNGRCHDQLNVTTDHFIRLKAYHKLEKASVQEVKAAIFYEGPVVVVVNMNYWGTYQRGVMDDVKECSPKAAPDHAVTVVGWGVEPDQPDKPYWIVKNSWGTQWGNDGYIHIAIEGNVCGVTNSVLVVTEIE